MLVSYTWLQSYFKDPLPEPHAVADVLSLHAFEIEGVEEKEGDVVIDVDVLPNRAHDCLSHRGIAKELAVILKISFKDPFERTEYKKNPATIKVDVENKERVRRYMARAVRNIKVAPSPDWLVKRLEALGQRSINNVVDATNFVMLDIGQPLHAFDKGKCEGGTIMVRNAHDKETIITLTDEEVALKDWMPVIADGEGEGSALAIAGVKGGKKAEVDDTTHDLILEAANFDPVTVRKTSRRISILTDSSKRFENDPTPEFVSEAMDRVTNLLVKIAGSEETIVEEPVDVYLATPKKHTVNVDVNEVTQILGLSLSVEDISHIFDQFGFTYTLEEGIFSVEIPLERIDLRIPEDLIEEIGRVYGYENIPSILPEVSKKPLVSKEFYYTTKIREYFIDRGFSEVYTYSFGTKGDVKIANPLASDKGRVRSTLIDGVRDSRELNKKHKDLLGLDKVKIFEIGTVFKKDGEYTALAFTAEGLKEKDVQEYVEELTKKYGLGKIFSHGQFKDGVYECQIKREEWDSLEQPTVNDLDLKMLQSKKTYNPISPYPVIVRDIAVWVKSESEKEKLQELIKKTSGELLASEPRLVDEYKKDGRISYAFRLVFQSLERTLSDEEVNTIMDQVYNTVSEQEGWEIR